jgi:hypothetical protein
LRASKIGVWSSHYGAEVRSARARATTSRGCIGVVPFVQGNARSFCRERRARRIVES